MIAEGGAGVPLSNAFEQFKKGTQFATEQHEAGQRSKLNDVALEMNKKQLKQQDVLMEKQALEVAQFKKSIPLWDAEIEAKTKSIARDAGLDELKFEYAFKGLQDDLATLPMEQHAKGLTAINQFLASTANDPAAYAKALSNPGMARMKERYGLTGDLVKDEPMRRSLAAAAIATPAIQRALQEKAIDAQAALEKERLRSLDNDKDRATTLEAARMRNETQRRGQDMSLEKAALKRSSSKTFDVGVEEIKVAAALLKADPYFSQFEGQQVTGLANRYATFYASYLQESVAKGVAPNPEAAQNFAYEKLKMITEAANPENEGFINQMKGMLGGKAVPAPSSKQAGPSAQRFEVDGRVYDIPADKVDAFKKAKGIK